MNPTKESIYHKYQKGLTFNSQIGLDETVEENENFFIGNQWEGVESNGLPTPVFNFLKQVVLFTVASITSDNIKMQASPLFRSQGMRKISAIVNKEFESLFEHNKIGMLMREVLRNAAVDGDGCTYTYFDPDAETGQYAKGAIKTEVVENTRVFFGNPNSRDVQKQPCIIIASREIVDDAKDRAEEYGGEPDLITPDEKDTLNGYDTLTDDKVTVLLYMWRDKESGTIHAMEVTKSAVLRPEWDIGIRLYPITWVNWDYIQDCYHGQAQITGLIPNQMFVNKLFAMSQISLMTMAYPKIVYDKTRIPRWDNRVGQAIGVNGGDVTNIAKVLEGAHVDPQIVQFISLSVEYTKSFLGATPAAMGETRPDNTSAIIALQRAAAVPNELTKQNLYQGIEDLGRIYIEYMAEYYGLRAVEYNSDMPVSTGTPTSIVEWFDFSELKNVPMSLKLDVGASAYWSEIASQQTMDNLLMMDRISGESYVKRIPNGYVSDQEGLINEVIEYDRQKQAAAMQQAGVSSGGIPTRPGSPQEIPTGKGYSTLQRSINQTGA